MPTAPSAQLFTLFVRAAKKHGISHSFLLAVADTESKLDPRKVDSSHMTGAGDKAGTITRRGLFQMSEEMLSAGGVTDATDPAQTIEAAAKWFATLKALSDQDAPIWSVSAGAFYFAKLGKGAFASSLAAGVQRFAEVCDGTVPDHWPDPPQHYVQSILESRRYYQDAALPQGKTPLEQLESALQRVCELYPDYAAAPGHIGQPMLAKLVQDVGKLKAARGSQVSDPDPGNQALHELWTDYARLFDALPYTDNTTPAPWRIEPNIPANLTVPAFGTVADVWEAVKEGAAELGKKAGEKLDELVLIGIGASVLLGALWIVVNRKRT